MSLTICWPLIIGALPLLALLATGLGGAIWLARRIERRIELQVAQALAHAHRAQPQAQPEVEPPAEPKAEQQAEARTTHDQRVQTLGRLTGSVVHEINNLLGVVSNSMHLIQRHAAAAELQMPLAATQRAVEAGSQLTQALLRCARHQAVRPQVVALGQQLPEVHELLRNVLGRRTEVSVCVDSATAPVMVDAGELELALINLALDARDAMPGGGQLWLRACNAGPEDTTALAGHPTRGYVIISVSDNGVGTSHGPGLSQAQRLCTRAGGAARQAGTPGVGTTVSLLLPAWRGHDEAAGRTVSDR